MTDYGGYNVDRPAGWEESGEEEDAGICEADYAPLRLPEYSDTWQGQTCKVMHSAWIAFDKWASRLLGLDESKYEWAVVESELMEQERLHDLANDSLAATEQISKMERGCIKPQPDANMEMTRPAEASEIPSKP
eukprot:jgi/Ulvmu1/9589/UM054_0019.1